MIESIIVAVCALCGTLGGAYLSNKKSSALIAYRLEELEQKVQKHNNLVERMYAVEQAEALLTQKIECMEREGK